MLGLYAGQPGARAWRRYLSQHSYLDGAGSEVLLGALASMPVAAQVDNQSNNRYRYRQVMQAENFVTEHRQC